jgi:hypothetical protein
MNKYRYVQYADDGCEEYQCLACKFRFTIRSASMNFCSHCGVKFEGQLECRPHNTPRWAWDRYGVDIPFGVQLYPQPKPPSKRRWIVESRSKWEGHEWSKWGYDGSFDLDMGYQGVKRWFIFQRDDHDPDDPYQIEYRARIGER